MVYIKYDNFSLENTVAKTDTVKARIEPELKVQGEAVLSAIGLNTTEAITMFFRQIVMHRGLPFDVKIPNVETIKVLENSKKGVGVSDPVSFEDFKDKYANITNEDR